MTTVIKVIANNPPTNNVQVATQDVHSTSLPSGSVILGSSGNTKPLAVADQQFCTVPVHIAPDNSVSFYFNGLWRFGNGAMAT
jgi:hypothetical protein